MEYELLLVNVVRDFGDYSEAFKECIGQYLLASYLRTHDFRAFVFSENSLNAKKIISREIENKKVPIIGFYAAADNIRVVTHVVKWLKETYPHVKTIIGGPQAIALDYDFFKKTKNDFAIMGEGEITLKLLLEYLVDNTGKLEKIPSIIYPNWEQEMLIVNHCDNAVIIDLDSIPYPVMEDSLFHNLRQGKMVGIITGRGCPNQCTFCYEGANAKNVRLRSIENVMEEIDYIKENNSNVEYLNIYDDTFTLRPDRVRRFCKEIVKRNLKWFCEGHITFVLNHADVIKEMIQAGMVCIQFGIESGSNKVLNGYNKRTNYQMIIEVIAKCKQLGLHGITGNFIIGGAFESHETIEETKQLAKELIYSAKGIIELYSVYFAPYPNTRIVNQPDSFEIMLQEDLMRYNLSTMRSPVVETENMSALEIYKAKEEFDIYLEQLYAEAARSSTKADVIQGLFVEGKRAHLNPLWEKHYLSLEYISNFIEHLSEEEQIFNEDYYLIRTFEDVVLDGDKLISKFGVFEGVEKDIMLNASGLYTGRELAELLHVPVHKIQEVYEKYNEKCMLYVSEF